MFSPSFSSLPGNKFRHNLQIYIDLLCGFLKQVTVFWEIALGKNRLFDDWIMQEMVPHNLGRTTLLHKSALSITMIFSMISFFRGKLLIKPALY